LTDTYTLLRNHLGKRVTLFSLCVQFPLVVRLSLTELVSIFELWVGVIIVHGEKRSQVVQFYDLFWIPVFRFLMCVRSHGVCTNSSCSTWLQMKQGAYRSHYQSSRRLSAEHLDVTTAQNLNQNLDVGSKNCDEPHPALVRTRHQFVLSRVRRVVHHGDSDHSNGRFDGEQLTHSPD
jgi:hypothetical protein